MCVFPYTSLLKMSTFLGEGLPGKDEKKKKLADKTDVVVTEIK